MTKIATSKYKISRRLGVSLWGRAKDPANTRNFAPGQHGPTGRKKTSGYGLQLRAKQQLKGYYNISEKQFRGAYEAAVKSKGDTSEQLIALLERRLDIIVYRLNFVATVFAARQLVSHKHVKVNGKIVNIPGYQLKDGDVIEVKEKSRTMPVIIEATQKLERDIPSYLDADLGNFKGKYVRAPHLADVPYPVQMEPKQVVEFYSR